ncbi:MAG TPA: hypothetical protein VNS08_02400 [Ureibacillus sp.]|nr:hypothetical protein [Ureibacillus sp.]
MRIPALPEPKEMELKKRGTVLKLLRQIFSKRNENKRSFVRIPPRK